MSKGVKVKEVESSGEDSGTYVLCRGASDLRLSCSNLLISLSTSRERSSFLPCLFFRFLYLHFCIMVIKKSLLKIKPRCGVLLKKQPGIQTFSTKATSWPVVKQDLLITTYNLPSWTATKRKQLFWKITDFQTSFVFFLYLCLPLSFFFFSFFPRNHQAKGLSPRWFWGIGVLF